jgi:uncharacterized protein (DUF2147 family)
MRATLAVIAFLALTAARGAAQTSIEGRWVNPSHSVIINIAACGDSLCGTVQWATAQAKQDASSGTDALVGTQLLTDLQQKGELWEGKLFVPDQNLHVEAKLEPAGDQQLKVSGCALDGMVCDSQLWARAAGPLPASHRTRKGRSLRRPA